MHPHLRATAAVFRILPSMRFTGRIVGFLGRYSASKAP
jgi:hypothetical protein